ncbi:hypothetical protein GJ496_004942 [Pomphorhynchus laevis]|nr:hypothetical protein GJ496_004942 [Pomphorhynchus laevis]
MYILLLAVALAYQWNLANASSRGYGHSVIKYGQLGYTCQTPLFSNDTTNSLSKPNTSICELNKINQTFHCSSVFLTQCATNQSCVSAYRILSPDKLNFVLGRCFSRQSGPEESASTLSRVCILKPHGDSLYFCECINPNETCNSLAFVKQAGKTSFQRGYNVKIHPLWLAAYIVICIILLCVKNPRTVRPDCYTLNKSPPTEVDCTNLVQIKSGITSSIWIADATYSSGTTRKIILKIFNTDHGNLYANEFRCYNELGRQCNSYVLRCLMDEKLNLPSSFPCADYILSFEYWSLGSLLSYIIKNQLSIEQCMHIAVCISRGMSYLHSVDNFTKRFPIIHRDFKSSNVLLHQKDNAISACICDFDISIVITSESLNLGNHKQLGTCRYMAPEMLEGIVSLTIEGYKSMDIYAVGIVLWELISRCRQLPETSTYKKPYQEICPCGTMLEMYGAVVVQELRPPILDYWRQHPSAIQTMISTIEDCWDADPDARISAACACNRLCNALSFNGL